MDPYVIYAFYNADQVQGVLNAIVMLMGSGGVDGDFLSLIRIAGMLGLFVAITVGFLRARGEDAGMYLIMMAIFYSTLFIPRVTVTIQDVGYAAGAPRTVANVPIGLAFFGSMTSKIGYWLTDRTETVFAFPDDNISFRKGGMMGASRALREAQGASFTEPILAQDMQLFMRDCINPEILVNPPALTALMSSRAIWADFNTLGLVNPGRIVSLASQPSAVNCQDAYTTILGPKIAAQVTTEASRIAKILSPFVPPAVADTNIATLLPASEGLVMTASASAVEAIQQRMMINLLNDTSQSLGQVMNDPTAVQNAVATAQASQSANSSYRIMAKLAAETLPMIRNALELVILGVFPFMLVLVIVAGAKGGIILRSYVMSMLWVQLWAPLYAIVNYVGTLTSAKRMTGALEGIDGVTVQNAAQLLNTTISGEAVVGLLTISVPMIALALVKGGEMAMSGVVSGMMGPSQGAAGKAGQEVGSGNISAGNVSWGNYNTHSTSSNKHNTDFNSQGGAYTFRDGGGISETQFRDGTAAISQPKHNTTLTGGNLASYGSELSSQATRSAQAGFSNIKSAVEQQSALFNQIASHIQTGGRTSAKSINFSNKQSGAYASSVGDDLSHAEDVTAIAGSRLGNTAVNQARIQAGASAAANVQAGGNNIVSDSVGRSTSQPVSSGQAGNLPVQAGQQAAPAGNASDHHRQTAASSKNAGSGLRTGFDLGGAIAAIQSYEAGIHKAIAHGDRNTATRLASERQSYINELAQSTGFTGTEHGGAQGSRGVDARLAKANSYIDQAQAQFQKADRLDESSRIMQSANASASHNAISDPRVFSAAEQRQFLADLGRAKTPEQRAAVLERLAQRIAGAKLGTEHADAHISGAQVKATDSDMKGAHDANVKSAELENKAGDIHKGNVKKVPAGKVGPDSVVPQAGLVAAVAGYTEQSKEKPKQESSRLQGDLENGKKQVAGETGFVNTDPRSSNMASLNKTANRATGLMTDDAEMSLRQVLPNAMSGSQPTLEQHQNAIGYDPSNPRGTGAAVNQGAAASAPATQAPPGWQPRIPEKKAASGGR